MGAVNPRAARSVALVLLATLLAVAPALAAFAQGDGTPSPLPPTPTYPFHGTYTPPAQPPPLPVPPPVALLNVDNDAVETILLLGSDSPDNYYRRTDVSIGRLPPTLCPDCSIASSQLSTSLVCESYDVMGKSPGCTMI